MVTLGVADLARAVDFYARVLGWSAAPSPPGIAFFDLGGIVLSLYPHDALAKDMKVTADAGRGVATHGFALAHNARSKDEVDSIFSRLKDHGATIVKPPEQVFWGGYSGYFSDPDGHSWEVAYNPHWVIRTDGRVSMGQE